MQTDFAVGACRLELRVADITEQDTDAIASAANALLLGGGGVDGAIHRAAGPELLGALRAIKKTLEGGVLPTGGAVITPGYRLKAKRVVHCVGPIYDRERGRAAELLEKTYREALNLVRAESLASITFPSISTGVYGYPVQHAAPVALGAVVDELRTHAAPTLVRFSLFDDDTYTVYRSAAVALLGEP